jgi:hypothetical protein
MTTNIFNKCDIEDPKNGRQPLQLSMKARFLKSMAKLLLFQSN